MAWQATHYTLLLGWAAAISAISSLYVWSRRPVAGSKTMVLISMAGAEWMVAYALELGSVSEGAKIFWNQMQYVGIVIVLAAWLAFALQYTGREKWLTRRTILLLSIDPIITLLLVFTNEAHGLIWGPATLETDGSFVTLVRPHGLGFWIHAAYAYTLLSAVIFLLIQMLIRSRHLYRRQASLLLSAASLPFLGSLLMVFGFNPFPPLDLTPIAFTVSSLILTWSFFRLRVGDIVPVAREVVIENMSDGVLVLDEQNRIVDLNPAAQHMVRRAPSETIGQPVEQVWPDWSGLIGRPQDENGAGKEIVLGEGGAQRTYDVRFSPIVDWRGRLTSQVIVLRDITERKHLEEQMRQQEQLAAIGQLAGGIAHDFNNLLTSIMLYAQLLLAKPHLPPDMTTQRIDLTSFVRKAADILQRTLPENIRLLIQVEEGERVASGEEAPSLTVNADPTRIQQALINLATNARDAMPEGGELRISLSRAEVRPGDEPPMAELAVGDWVCLTVSDTGTGIPPDVLPHIFEPFFTTKGPGQGTGLGLAQVHGIVKQHGGCIGVETEVGRGTTFRVYLPAYDSEDVEAVPEKELAPPKGRGETILLAEDEERVREAGREILESLGYQVLTAADGREALEVYRSAETVDLVVTDLIMPEMGGKKLAQELKKEHPHVRVLAITGYALGEDTQELKEAGILQSVPKPFDIGTLGKAVRRALDAE
jgi:PAS domain S-box-containing protein